MSFRRESLVRALIGLGGMIGIGSYLFWGPGLYVPGAFVLLALATTLFVLGLIGFVIAKNENSINKN